MPFLKLVEPEHACRVPGRSVGKGTRWYCDACMSVYEFVECDMDSVSCVKTHGYGGHWVFTGKLFVPG